MIELLLARTSMAVCALMVISGMATMLSCLDREQSDALLEDSASRLAELIDRSAMSDCPGTIRLDLKDLIPPDTAVRICGSSVALFRGGTCKAEPLHVNAILPGSDDGALDADSADVLLVVRSYSGGAPLYRIYVENVDATLATASTNRSTSPIVL